MENEKSFDLEDVMSNPIVSFRSIIIKKISVGCYFLSGYVDLII